AAPRPAVPAPSAAAPPSPGSTPQEGASGALASAAPGPAASGPGEVATPSPGSGGITVEAMRRSWDAVLDELRGIKRFTWTLVSQEAQVLAVDAQTLTLGFAKPGLVETFTNRGQGAVVREALLRATGVDRTVVASVDRRAGAGDGPGPGSPAGGPRSRPGNSPPSTRSPAPSGPSEPPEPPEPPDVPEPPEDVEPPRVAGAPRTGPDTAADVDGAALVRRLLGAQVIEETPGG
ncbi:MAG: hypothetical protein ACFCVG_08545, partial [Kineosporiaceae bacterium]